MAGRHRDGVHRPLLSSNRVAQQSDALLAQERVPSQRQGINSSRQSLKHGNHTQFTVQGIRPENYMRSHILMKTGLPDSEPIYHEIEAERQKSMKRQRPPEPNNTGKSMSPARQRVLAVASGAPSSVGTIKPFRPLPNLHLLPEETEQNQNEVERLPSDVKDTWLMYGDAIESGSVLTGLSRQELLRRHAGSSNDDVKKKKEKKYGKKKNKSLILNLPLPFSKRVDDWPKYCRGAEELSSNASAGASHSGSRRAQLTERWARRGVRRFVGTSSTQKTQHRDNSHQGKISAIGSPSSEDLTSAMSSQSPQMVLADHDASMSDDVGFGTEINDQIVQEWLASDSVEPQLDRSMQSDDCSFPYLSAAIPPSRHRPSRSPPPHLDSSVTHSIAAASDQAVADSTASVDDLRLKALEITVSFDVLENKQDSHNVWEDGEVRSKLQGERNIMLATEAVKGGNDSPTSVADIRHVEHAAQMQSAPVASPYHHNSSTAITSSQKRAPKSILRRKPPRSFLSDCPSDEGGSLDECDIGYHLPRQKTVRINIEANDENVAMTPPRDGSFRDDEGQELSPIQPEKPALPNDEDKQQFESSDIQSNRSTPNVEYRGGSWPTHGWRESDSTKSDLAQVREDDEGSEGESEGYSLGFIEEVAAVVIQTAVRQLLAKMIVLDMLEKSLSYVPESNFSDMTFRMFSLAAIKIQSAFRGWWIRDSLSVDHYCATLIQRMVRGFLHRSNYHFDLYRIIVVQSICRRNAAREIAVNRLSAVIAIQAAFRGYLVRISFEDAWGLARREIWAATKIQARWRGYDAQMNYLHTLADILVVQSIARAWITRRVLVPYLRSLRVQESDAKEAKKRRDATHTSKQHRSETRTHIDRYHASARMRSRQSRQTPKPTEEVESRSDGESGASEIIQALRASEQKHPRAWKQLSTTTSTPKRRKASDISFALSRHAQRVRLPTQKRK